MLDKLNIVQQRYNEVSDLIIQPDIITDQKRYIKLNKENTKDEIETVYVKDFELRHDGSKLDVEKVFKYPNTIFAKIKHNQSIVMTSVLEKHTVKENGAGHCPGILQKQESYIFRESDIPLLDWGRPLKALAEAPLRWYYAIN